MDSGYLDDIEVKRQLLADEADKLFSERAKAISLMTKTDGWDILSRELKENQMAQMQILASLPVIPENIPAISIAQARYQGCQFVFDMVDNYTKRPN